MPAPKPSTIDEYIGTFPEGTQRLLEEVRATIKKAVKGTGEKISYGIPCITLNDKYLLYFAGYKKHIGLYPVPAANKGFEKDYAPCVTSGKGTIQFPLDEPLPLSLIKKIAKFRAKNSAKANTKPAEKTKSVVKKKVSASSLNIFQYNTMLDCFTSRPNTRRSLLGIPRAMICIRSR
jgi:uncharacterized protein YdhG (YjbR/CyaY superfamily)